MERRWWWWCDGNVSSGWFWQHSPGHAEHHEQCLQVTLENHQQSHQHYFSDIEPVEFNNNRRGYSDDRLQLIIPRYISNPVAKQRWIIWNFKKYFSKVSFSSRIHQSLPSDTSLDHVKQPERWASKISSDIAFRIYIIYHKMFMISQVVLSSDRVWSWGVSWGVAWQGEEQCWRVCSTTQVKTKLCQN